MRLVQLSEEDLLEKSPTARSEVVGAVTPEQLGKALADVKRWREAKLDIRTVLDASYPGSLQTIFNRPPLLFIQGRWTNHLFGQSIAVVGTRRASDAGREQARLITRELVEAGFSIVSGLAQGIDTVAHTTALENSGPTGAVIGTGIFRQFPKENAALAKDIIGVGGGILSQFFPEQPPTSWTFPMRNIVMSGLTLATVVIEAAETSGARLQARVALQHGRTVFLLRSLVEKHEWARRYVTDGAYGTRAIEIASAGESIRPLGGDVALQELQLTA